ncbi:hypothetical protein AGDE_10063 [Angomonas deanei]|uniref:PLAC8 family n=1 Tax=Angomonas deanei TaxID=59799 RepID=A0A7G2CX93_9TRYP|nr:hypothetical protein AGDE_10063 [Angomonas deanei]CAD2222902.1 hypothetical protein, conserved [Angomonas deanei]|eukprot:EPY29224.1 hypothetical protein AGDE_10063 [Angomonas deanei]
MQGAEGFNENYYYYYTMPDGSYGYVQDGNRDFTPRESLEQPQPNGYSQGPYGGGTGYAVPQTQSGYQAPQDQYYYDANTGCYYYYSQEAEGSQEPTAEGESTALAAPQTVSGNAAYPAETEGFLYVPPTSYNDVGQWKGARDWAEGPCHACSQSPCYCIGACLCPWCLIMVQRKRLLLNDWSNYICCAGMCGHHSCCGIGGCCLMCCEVACCLPCSFHGNRYMLMRHYSLKPIFCDRCIAEISCVCAVFRCCSDWSPICCDCCYLPLLCCLLTQQRRQMEVMEYPKVEVMV